MACREEVEDLLLPGTFPWKSLIPREEEVLQSCGSSARGPQGGKAPLLAAGDPQTSQITHAQGSAGPREPHLPSPAAFRSPLPRGLRQRLSGPSTANSSHRGCDRAGTGGGRPPRDPQPWARRGSRLIDLLPFPGAFPSAQAPVGFSATARPRVPFVPPARLGDTGLTGAVPRFPSPRL